MLTQLHLILIVSSAIGHQESALRKSLLRDYDPNALPAKQTNLSIGFGILHVDMNEKDQVMILDVWPKMKWYDPRLQWKSEDYPEIKSLAIMDSDVWTPDVMMYNSNKFNTVDHITKGYHVIVYATGNILYVPTANLHAPCVLDMTYWPHDTHVCSFTFGSWVHDGNKLNLQQNSDMKNGFEFEMTEITGGNGKPSKRGWSVQNTSLDFETKYYACCPEPYVSVILKMTVKRNAPSYSGFVKVLITILSALTGILFLLPPGSVEKVVVGTLVLILDMQFLVYIKDMVQHSPTHTPLIVQAASGQLLMTFFCVFLSAMIVRLVKDPHCDSLPSYLRKIVSMLERPFCLGGYRKMVKQSEEKSFDHEDLISDQSEDKEAIICENVSNPAGNFQAVASAEWLMLGALLDRLLFVIYVVYFSIKLTCHSSWW